MFDQTFVDSNAHTRKPWTIGLSLILQLGITAVLLLIPLLHPEMLKLKLEIPVWVPLKPPPRELPLKTTATPGRTSPVARIAPIFTAPTRVPTRQISMESDAPQFTSMMMTGPASASGSSTIPGWPDTMPAYSNPQPPPAAIIKKPEAPKGPTRVGGGVQSARLIFGPKPPYPALAKAARVQGTVRIQAVIAPDGAIRNLSVMGGPPLLFAAALEAVRQWRYRPTLLNGEPVEVATEIDVNFTLSQ